MKTKSGALALGELLSASPAPAQVDPRDGRAHAAPAATAPGGVVRVSHEIYGRTDRVRGVAGPPQGLMRQKVQASCGTPASSIEENPASRAYLSSVARRRTVPVPSAPGPFIAEERHVRTLQP